MKLGRNQTIAVGAGLLAFFSTLGFGVLVALTGKGLEMFDKWASFVELFTPALVGVILGASAMVKRAEAAAPADAPAPEATP